VVLAVYVGQASQVNLRVGLDNRVWGFKTWQAEYAELKPGDQLYLGMGFPGSPECRPMNR